MIHDMRSCVVFIRSFIFIHYGTLFTVSNYSIETHLFFIIGSMEENGDIYISPIVITPSSAEDKIKRKGLYWFIVLYCS